jgi:hypothetical protein
MPACPRKAEGLVVFFVHPEGQSEPVMNRSEQVVKGPTHSCCRSWASLSVSLQQGRLPQHALPH